MVKKGTAPRKATAVLAQPLRGGLGPDRRSRRGQSNLERVHSASDDEDDGVWQALFHGPAHEAGAFYNQIHDEIKMLRSRVDQKLKDMIVGGQEDVDALNRQLHSLKSQASSDSEQDLVPFAVEAGAGIFSEDIRKLHDTMRIEEEMSKKRIESAKAEERSYDDLHVSSSTATEPATNLTRATVARRLEKVNFPESGPILEQEHESSSSSSSNGDEEDDRHRQTVARRQRKQLQRKGNRMASLSPKDAVTAARKVTTEDPVTNARFGIESPPRRRFFPDGSTFPPEHVYEEHAYPDLDAADSFSEQDEEGPNPRSNMERRRQSSGSDLYGDSSASHEGVPHSHPETHDPPLNRTASEVHRSIAQQPAQRPPKLFFPPSPSMEPPATHVGESTRSRVVPDPDAVAGASPRKETEKASSKAKQKSDTGVSMRELNEGNLDLLVASLEYLDSNLKSSASSGQLERKKEHSKSRPTAATRRSNENKLDRMMASLEYLDEEDQGSSSQRPLVADDQLRPLAVNNHKAMNSASASSRSAHVENHEEPMPNSDYKDRTAHTDHDGHSSGRSRRSNEVPATTAAARPQRASRNIRGRDQPEYTTSMSETSRSSTAVSYRYEYDYNGRRIQRPYDREYYQLHDEAEELKEASLAAAASRQHPKHQQQQHRTSVAGGGSRPSQTPSAASRRGGSGVAARTPPAAVSHALVDWPDGHSHASDHSYASRSIAIKSASLHSIAQSSVTDSMDLDDHGGVGGNGGTGPAHLSSSSPGRDLLAELEEEVGAGVCVKIEKVQNHELTDPYGDKGRYTGLLVKEKPYGHGSMHYEDGRSYTGEWKHGRWHGKGRTLFVNGDFFVGEYVKDQRHGLGRYEWSDGRVYDGHFKRDRRDGKGTYTWPDGAIYTGDFKAGQRHGQGCYKFKDGSVYTGEFREGLYHGVGECVWSDGRCYRGEWSRGHANGYGIEIRPDGTIRHEGEWKNDRPVRLRGEPVEQEKVEKKKSMFPEGDRDPRQRRSHASHALPVNRNVLVKSHRSSAPGSHYSAMHRPIVVSNLDP